MSATPIGPSISTSFVTASGDDSVEITSTSPIFLKSISVNTAKAITVQGRRGVNESYATIMVLNCVDTVNINQTLPYESLKFTGSTVTISVQYRSSNSQFDGQNGELFDYERGY